MGFSLEKIIVDVALLVAMGKILEGFLGRLNIPSFTSYVLVGFILGPSILGLVSYGDSMSVVASIALFFVALYAGLEVPYAWFTRSSFRSMELALVSFSLTYIPSFIVCLLLGLSVYESLVASLVVSVTALPVAAAVLAELGLLSSRLGALVMGSAIVTDILAITILGVLVGLATGGSLSVHSLARITMGVLILASLVVVSHLLIKKLVSTRSRLLVRASRLFESTETGLALVLVVALVMGALSESLGLHFVVGVFLVGLIVDSVWLGEESYKRVVESVKGVTLSLLLPLFAAIIGLVASTGGLELILSVETLKLAIVFTLLALALRYLAGYMGARITGLTSSESKLVGIALTLKGAMDKIVLLAAYQQGIVTSQLLIPLMVALVTATMVTPATLKITLNTMHENTQSMIARVT